jgi:hypothetical protein
MGGGGGAGYNLWQQEKLKPRTKSSAAHRHCGNMVAIAIKLAYNSGL